MNSAIPPEWYLEIEGKKSGPFTAEQIEGFLHDREILARHRVFSPRRPEQKMTAGEFVSALDHQRKAQAKARPFHAPDKPRDMDERTGIIQARSAQAADPTQHLFDALQAVRERQSQAKLATPTDAEWGTLTRTAPARRSQMLLVTTLMVLLGISIWGLNRLLARDAATSIAKTHETPAFAPPVEAQKAEAKHEPETLAHKKTSATTSTAPASTTSSFIARGRPGLAPAQGLAVPAALERAREQPAEKHVDEDRDTRLGNTEGKPVDRDPVAEYERQQQGGDGSLQPLLNNGESTGNGAASGETVAPPAGEPQPIDPNELKQNPIE